MIKKLLFTAFLISTVQLGAMNPGEKGNEIRDHVPASINLSGSKKEVVRNTNEQPRNNKVDLYTKYTNFELDEIVKKYVGKDYFTPNSEKEFDNRFSKKVKSSSSQDQARVKQQAIQDKLNKLTAHYVGACQATRKGAEHLRNKFAHGGFYRGDKYTQKDLINMTKIIHLFAELKRLEFEDLKATFDVDEKVTEGKKNQVVNSFKEQLELDKTKCDLMEKYKKLTTSGDCLNALLNKLWSESKDLSEQQKKQLAECLKKFSKFKSKFQPSLFKDEVKRQLFRSRGKEDSEKKYSNRVDEFYQVVRQSKFELGENKLSDDKDVECLMQRENVQLKSLSERIKQALGFKNDLEKSDNNLARAINYYKDLVKQVRNYGYHDKLPALLETKYVNYLKQLFISIVKMETLYPHSKDCHKSPCSVKKYVMTEVISKDIAQQIDKEYSASDKECSFMEDLKARIHKLAKQINQRSNNAVFNEFVKQGKKRKLIFEVNRVLDLIKFLGLNALPVTFDEKMDIINRLPKKHHLKEGEVKVLSAKPVDFDPDSF